jgi:hypothetical protein
VQIVAFVIDDPEHWRSRAEEARSIAEQLSDPESKPTMFRIAADYDRLAEHAELRARTESSHWGAAP